MELKYRYFLGSPREVSVGEAVSAKLTSFNQDSGMLEDMRRTVESQTEYLAALTTRLVDKGVLSSEDVEALLPAYEVVG